ncbi:hypothetical protein PBY51_020721 [Eleginops maclovinus]|uniref:Uncharacterized protein n=1 Tax=Eleginops maclovinus TaxID=56733 RepID=A0AAN7XMF8_ELEMC|nr:hypothetical protein PBY51_020721 [Eleginops maclovinus]
MKFKHSEPLEVPPWKKRRRKGREAKKKGKICGFDAGISPWGMAGAGWYGDPERFQNVCNVPHDTIFRAIPRQRSRTNWEEEKGKTSRSKSRKVDGTGKSERRGVSNSRK